MVGDLIRLKLALTRNQVVGGRAAWAWTGAAAGGSAALLVVALAAWSAQAIAGDLLAAAYLIWLVGWVVGPLMSPAQPLHPGYFATLPIPRYRLAAGLLVAGFVGLASAVTILLFASLPLYGARLGVWPFLLAVPVAAIQLGLVVLISRTVHLVFGRLARARAGAALSGLTLATVLVLTQSGWMVLVGLTVSGIFEHGFPSGVASALRWAPSGWGLAAVEAAGARDWVKAWSIVTAMLVLAAVLLAAWGGALGQARGARTVVRGSSGRPTPRRFPFNGPTGAIVLKELLSWWRDPARTTAVAVPIVWGVLTAVLPLSFGAAQLLPWAGTFIALMAATWLANMYSFDGTGLWITVQTGTERADVRARQWAYLIVFGPLAIAVTVAFTAWSNLSWAWPWALAAVTATLGGGAGLVAYASVAAPEPGPDAHERRNSPGEGTEGVGTAFLVFFAACVPPVPGLGIVLFGTVGENPVVQWAGVLISIAVGAFVAVGLGRAAAARLERTAPEVLLLMRSGRAAPGVVKAPAPGDEPVASGRERAVVLVGLVLGPLALFAQGLVPVVLKLTGNHDVRVWFLAMYLPDPWGWLTCTAMILIGGTLIWLAVSVLRQHGNPKRSLRPSSWSAPSTPDPPGRLQVGRAEPE